MDNVELFDYSPANENSMSVQKQVIAPPLMQDEMELVNKEGRFFIKMLKQSIFYSNGNRKQDIQELTSQFENFLINDQKDLDSLIAQEGQKKDGMNGIEQKWTNFRLKFNDLKKHAMNVLGDFFTVRFR